MSNRMLVQEINKAVGAHGVWKLKLRTAISRGSSDTPPSTVRNDGLCEFGKWLNGPHIDPAMRSSRSYQDAKRLHAEFHRCAARVLELALNDRKDEANAILEGEFNERSQNLIRTLGKWKAELSMSSTATASV